MTINSIEALNSILFEASREFVLTPEQYDIVMNATLNDFDPEAQKVIKRLQYSIRRGWVRVT